jgi:hypothetical protein
MHTTPRSSISAFSWYRLSDRDALPPVRGWVVVYRPTVGQHSFSYIGGAVAKCLELIRAAAFSLLDSVS